MINTKRMIYTKRHIIVTKSNNRTYIKVYPVKQPFISTRKLFFNTTNGHEIVISLKDLVSVKEFRPNVTRDIGATLKHYM